MRQKLLAVTILVVALYFPFFSHLSLQPFRLWDETRQAMNAYEMVQNGDVIVTSYNGKPDVWNLKPPLLIWCQVFLMKIFGPWELAVRLPSALCGFFTSLMLFIFSWKYLNRFWLGYIAAIVLSTSERYLLHHGTRSGDYDSMLTFFTVLYCLSFFLFFEKGKWKYFYWGMTGVILAAMTKGIAGFLFLPAIAIAAFFYGKIKILLTSKHFYFSLLLLLTVVGGYYLLREHYNPGYIQAVIFNELGGRYNSVIEGHDGSFWFYYEKVHVWFLTYWSILIPCGFIAGLLDTDKLFNRFSKYITCIIVLFWLILSTSATKISWYFYPALPLLSITIATFLYYLFTIIDKTEIQGMLKLKILPFLFIFIIAFHPYREIFNRVYLAPEQDWEIPNYRMSYYLRDLAKGKFKLSEPVKIVYDGVHDHILYYMIVANDNGSDVKFKNKENLETGELILCSQEQIDRYLNENYSMEVINHRDYLYLYRITGRKILLKS